MYMTESTSKMSRIKTPKPVNEYRTLLVLSASFTAIFTAYLAIQNLQSSLNQAEGLGIISLSCMYACIIVSGILAPAVINILGEKWTLFMAFISHLIYISTNFYPTFATLIPSSVLIGATAGPMWTSQSVYLADRAYSYALRNECDGHTVLSRFNGIFFAMYETTQITGNLISSLVLQQDSYNDTNDVNETFCGRHDCPGSGNGTAITEPSRDVVYILLGVFLACGVIGVALVAFFLPPLEKKTLTQKNWLRNSVGGCMQALSDVDLALLVPLFMFMAMEQGILWTDYTRSFVSCPIGIQKIGFVMASYGGSTTVFALSLSRISKYTGRQFLFGLAGIINLGVLIVLYVWIPSPSDTVYIFIVPVVWGMAEGIWQTQSNALVALFFEDKKDRAFANYHTWKAVGFTVTFVYSNFLCVSIKLIVAMALLVVSMCLYAIVEIRFKRRQ